MKLRYYCPTCGKLGPLREWLGVGKTRVSCDECRERMLGMMRRPDDTLPDFTSTPRFFEGVRS